MTIGYADDVREDRLKALCRKIDSGSGPGVLRLYTGPKPALGAAITTETLVVSIPLNKPSAGAYSAGELALSIPSAGVMIAASGAPAWARFVNSDGVFCADLSCGKPDPGALGVVFDIELSTDVLYAGGEFLLDDVVLVDAP